MRKFRRAVGALAAVSIVALLTIGQAGARTNPAPSCGLVVTSNTTLSHNLDFSGGPGICIEADNVTLNLNGHTVEGGSGGYDKDGVLVLGDNDQVRNGTIADFEYDVYVDDSSNATVQNLKIVTNGYHSYYGVFLYRGSGHTVRNVACVNAYSCIGLDGSDVGDAVSNSLVTGNSDVNGEYAFWDDYGTSNTFSQNKTTGSTYGFYTYLTGADTFAKNRSSNGTYAGFFDDENSEGTVYSNNTAQNGDYGFLLYGNYDDDSGPQGGYTLTRNTASGNENEGFYTEYGFHYNCVCPTDAGSSFIQNTAKNNGGDGFYDYWSINSTWSGNTASGNGGSGFELQYPQNDAISGNTSLSNQGTGIWLRDNSTTYTAQSFANNRAQSNHDYGFYGDSPQGGTGNVARKNTPFDCWNISCQAHATLATTPTRPVDTGGPVKRPHTSARPHA